MVRGGVAALRLPGTRVVATMAGASLVAAGVAFIVNILSARVLGPEYRGHVALVLQLAYVIAPLLGAGADRALLRPEKDRAREHYLLPSLVGMLTGSGLVALFIWLVYGPWAALAALVAIVTVSFNLFRSVAISSGRQLPYLCAFLLYQASILIETVVLTAAGVQAWQWWAGVYLVPGIFLAAYALRRVRRDSPLPVAGPWAALRSNGALLAASISSLIVLRFERVILPVLAGAEALGLFIVVATATEPLYWVAQALADQRTSSSMTGAPRHRRQLVAASVRDAAFFAPLGIVGGIVLALVLVPLFGEAYAPAGELIFPLVVAAILLALYRQASGRLLGSSLPNRLGAAETATASAALIIYPCAILLAGATGAAWGSVLVYAVGWAAAIVAYPPSTPETSCSLSKENTA